ncbi:serine protease [Mesorhizobium sp.]|uniref:S1 family peptidase n=1 Tax=Mesorhizobium sp. TaxID=1871066 RepID=UPI00257CABA2|nr:serine protease [Mesorhizobium sp.]
MKLAFSVLLAAISVSMSLLTTAVAAVEQTIVYLECVDHDGKTSRGTGVIVSPLGHVLTARHVILEGSTCKGSVGVSDISAMRKLIVQPIQLSVDAALLRFTESKTYDFANFCALEDWMVRRRIFIAGFPAGGNTGVPSFRQGILSTVFPGPDGLIETDGQSASGMGGAPVFTSDLDALVGIVMGARFNTQGLIEAYQILPISLYAQTFGLVQSASSCYHRVREVDLSGRVSTWRKGDGPVKLGIHADEGICFIAGFWGEFDNALDSVNVELEGDEYILKGNSQSGGQIGASARCMWYD